MLDHIQYVDEDDTPFDGDENPLWAVSAVHFELDYTYRPGDPGCRYTRNGDGWPPSGPDVDWTTRCVLLEMKSGVNRKPTISEAKRAVEWFDKKVRDSEVFFEHIYDKICAEEADY